MTKERLSSATNRDRIIKMIDECLDGMVEAIENRHALIRSVNRELNEVARLWHDKVATHGRS